MWCVLGLGGGGEFLGCSAVVGVRMDGGGLWAVVEGRMERGRGEG